MIESRMPRTTRTTATKWPRQSTGSIPASVHAGAARRTGRIPMCRRANPLARGRTPIHRNFASPITTPRVRKQSGNWPTRIADHHAKGAKTVWQLAYAGSVGSQVLLGLPALKRLVGDPRIKGQAVIWPFETGLSAPNAPVVIAEIYPSLLKPEIRQRRNQGEILDAAQVRVNADAFARLDKRYRLAPLFGGDMKLPEKERRTIETEEAWILGLGHEGALRDALDLL